ncbi:flippase [Lactiplantibacillus herbarum]|uniref:flippase n=1 Tax=Lactiplantibacillus herbarum TaxID=1670446 RepID=UPI00064E7382|nr:flippase [Lactiplantibacillus herbarum]
MKIHSVKYNALFNVIYTLSNIIFPLITFPYVSRVLMATGNGKVNFFTSIATYGTTIAGLGLSTYGIRAVAKVRENRKKLSELTVELLVINFIGSVVVLGVLIISAFFVKEFRTELALFTITCVTILLSVIGMNWFYSGLEQYDYITRRSIIFKLISLILVFIFVKTKDDYVAYALITMFSTVGSYVFNFIYSRKFIEYRIDVKSINMIRHVKPTLLLFSSILAVSVYTNLDTIMLGFFSGNRAVGLYTVAVKIKWLLLMLINALSAVLLPRLSKHVEDGNLGSFNKIIKQSMEMILFISIPLTFFFIIMAKETVLVIGGRDYKQATLCMVILMPILIVSGFSNITGNQVLIPLGRDKAFLYAVSTGAVLNLILNIFVLPKYGANGAAVDTLLAEFLQMAIQAMFCRKIIKNNFKLKSFLQFIGATVIASVAIIVIKALFDFSPVVGIIILSIVFASIYLVVLIISKNNFFSSILREFRRYLKVL